MLNAYMTVYWFATGHNEAVYPAWVLYCEGDIEKAKSLHNKLDNFGAGLL